MAHYVFVSNTKPNPIWRQLSPSQLVAVARTTGCEFAIADECKGFIRGLITASNLSGHEIWFTCGLPNEAGINHDCWTSVLDDQAEFRWMDWFED
jgi:hypothetical protein